MSPRLEAATSDQSRPFETPQPSQTNTAKRRLFASPLARDSASQFQKIFQAARGALHRDIFAASSPASSIESRMNLEHAMSWQPDGGVGTDTKEWRYSTAPQNLAAASVDVREPLPSPTLPDISTEEGCSIDEIMEPVSSGFASPTIEHHTQNAPDPGMANHSSDGTDLENVSSNSHSSAVARKSEPIGENGVDEDMQRLQFESDQSDENGPEGSPTVRHLKSRSCRGSEDFGMQVSPTNTIYLSESAEAAAESAKAKRRWLRGIFPEDKDEDGEVDEQNVEPNVQLPSMPVMCPDPIVHQMVLATPCPEPSVHSQSPPLYRRPVEYYDSDVVLVGPEGGQTISAVPNMSMHRATATGSPMPFPRLRSRPPTAYSDRQSLRSPTPLSTRAQSATLHEHFQPGWYYARESIRPSSGLSYSFSTAASKAIGSDQAPDSRMRDSYKTDTLTALPVSTTRYRKNGIGAQVVPRGVSRYYERPPSSTGTGSSRPRPTSRQTYSSSNEVRFRSSPPRALREDRFPPMRRKRAMDDSFVIAEDMYRPAGITPEARLAVRDDVMQIDERISTAVRTSVFGASTPEALRSARQGIRELSPNVQMYRKGTQENMHLRKKRRPSYWDNDLKQVRESPAGRGGVRSPVSAQESMRAEFEVASQRNTEMGFDEVDLIEDAAGSTVKA